MELSVGISTFSKKTNMHPFNYLHKEATKSGAPLLLLLHGYGSNEADLFSLAPYLPNDFHIVSLRAPRSLSFGYAWFPIHFDAAMERWTDEKEVHIAISYINDFIDAYTSSNAINPEKVFLMGFSQGAMLSLSVGLTRNSIQGIAALSGYLDHRLEKPTASRNLPIYISHGSADEVVPYVWAKQSVERLKGFGYHPEFYTYTQGHGINQENLDALIEWLQKQR